MKTIHIENNFAQVCPGLKIGIIGAQVTNTETAPRLWEQIDDEASRIAAAYKIDEINKRPAIQATRKAYRSFGKDPNRYRVSSEALCRRIIRGLGIYRIDTLVDLINLVSVRSGYSIGAFRCRSYRRRHSHFGSRERRRNLPRYRPGRSQYRRTPGLPRR